MKYILKRLLQALKRLCETLNTFFFFFFWGLSFRNSRIDFLTLNTGVWNPRQFETELPFLLNCRTELDCTPCSFLFSLIIPADNYTFKVSNRNTKTRCEICSKLTIKMPERRHWLRSDIFIVNFENILRLVYC